MLSPTAASPLTQVDAFVSHSWGDDGTCKMAALRDWASEFEAAHGRRPTVWLDKGSIDQTSVAADLAGLPLYLLGCRSLPPSALEAHVAKSVVVLVFLLCLLRILLDLLPAALLRFHFDLILRLLCFCFGG